MMVLKEINLCLVIMLSTLVNQHSATEELTRRYASKLCPYNNFCNVKATKVLSENGAAPCCSACSCEDDCWRASNCCYDKGLRSNKTSDLICESTWVSKSSVSHGASVEDGLNQNIRRYFINDKCPDGSEEREKTEACSIANDVRNVDDLIWVSDAATGEIYKNRYCAACHGIKKWNIWKIRVSCVEVLQANFSTLSDVVVNGDCDIINEAPDGENDRAEKCRCYTPAVSSCNETGLWRHYDATVEKTCQEYMYNVPFFRYGIKSYIIYKNIFCAICNQDESSTVDEVCPNRETGKAMTKPFSAVIDFGKVSLVTEDVGKCAWDETYDIYSGKCRQLICPPGSVNHNGECKALPLSLYNAGVEVIFRLKISWENLKISMDVGNLSVSEIDGKNIINDFEHLKELIGCLVCEAELRVLQEKENRMKRPLEDLIIRMTFHLNELCQLDDVYRRVRKVIGRSFRMVIKNVSLESFVQLETRSSATILSQKITKFIILGSVGFLQCPIYLSIIRPPCAEVKLSEEELMDIIRGKEEIAINYIRDVNTTDAVYVCFDDYFALRKQITSAAGVMGALVSLLVGTILLQMDTSQLCNSNN